MWFHNELILNGEYGTNGLPCHENAMKSFRTGLECTINWNIIDKLYANANYSYSWNKVLSKTFGKVNHILTPDYTLDFDLFYRNKMWHVGANVNSRGKMFVDMENKHSIPKLITLNLYGSVNINDIELGLKCNNITNRTNYNTGMVNAYNEVLYIRNSGFNIHAIAKIFF
jgi:iron complex outermembrane receptor protein